MTAFCDGLIHFAKSKKARLDLPLEPVALPKAEYAFGRCLDPLPRDMRSTPAETVFLLPDERFSRHGKD